jgi:hypothetical protein
MSRVTGPSTGDLVPLAERLRIMQCFRLGVGVFVVLLSEVLHLPLLVPPAELLAATAAYLLLMLLSEAAWRLMRGRGLLLFGLMLITDGLYLAWAAHATGGSGGPLRLVVLLHLISVALLASPRTALKLALWHSLLLFVVHYAQQGGLLTAPRAPGRGCAAASSWSSSRCSGSSRSAPAPCRRSTSASCAAAATTSRRCRSWPADSTSPAGSTTSRGCCSSRSSTPSA